MQWLLVTCGGFSLRQGASLSYESHASLATSSQLKQSTQSNRADTNNTGRFQITKVSCSFEHVDFVSFPRHPTHPTPIAILY